MKDYWEVKAVRVPAILAPLLRHHPLDQLWKSSHQHSILHPVGSTNIHPSILNHHAYSQPLDVAEVYSVFRSKISPVVDKHTCQIADSCLAMVKSLLPTKPSLSIEVSDDSIVPLLFGQFNGYGLRQLCIRKILHQCLFHPTRDKGKKL